MLQLRDVDQFYGGSHILRGVSLDVPARGVTALLGRNGVGKTTLLRAIMGVVPVRAGAILWDGRPIQTLGPAARARLGLGYVPQGREIFGRLTVEENLRMGLAARPRGAGVPEEIYELFPVLHTMRLRRGGDLSGGQQQQLAIARALVTKPRLLILDEPTEGIQPSIIRDFERVIARLAAAGDMAILLVEQYYDFARTLADRYAVMSRGAVVARGAGCDMERDGVRAMVAI